MRRTYQYRLYPNRAQVERLCGLLHLARTLYNAALEQRIKAYRGEGRHSIGYNAQATDWRDLRNADPCFGKLNMSAGQQVFRRLDKAFQRFFKTDAAGRKAGFPRFKAPDRWRSLAFIYGDGASFRGDRLYIQNVGHIKVNRHRNIPDGAKIKQVRLVRRASGWYVQLSLELPDAAPLTEGAEIGVDLGLLCAVALSDGTLGLPVRPYRSGQAKLRRLTRRVARRRKGSARRRKAVFELARYHERVASRRRDQLHKLSREVVDGARFIALEDMRLAFMVRNRHLSKAAMDTALGMLASMIQYKAESAGTRIVKVNPAYTSQDCSGCGFRVAKTLGDRVHACPSCGLILHRDTNAAINVLSKARMEPSGANRGTPVRAVA